jgi:radical SAM superfamily enzyme YgiQ (UPF0313 family)
MFILSATPEISAANAELLKIRYPIMAPSTTVLILAELARAAGNHRVELLDTRLYMRLFANDGEGKSWTTDYAAIEEKILAAQPDLIGISFMSSSAPESYEIARLARKHGIAVIAGGLHAKVAERELIEENVFDYIYHGEAETEFGNLLKRLENGEKLPENRRGKSQILDGGSLPLKEMNRVPPVRDFSYYSGVMAQYERHRPVYVELSRGCVKNCSFCEVAKTGGAFKPFRPIPLENIYQTIRSAVAAYGANYIQVSDSIATLHKKNFLEFTRVVRAEFPQMTVQFNSTVDRWDEEIAEAVKEMSCTVWFGFESGSQRMLDFIDKGTTVEQAHRAARLCRKYDIPGGFNILIGVPGETRDDYDETWNFFVEHPNAYPNPNILNPLPGTEMYRFCKHRNLLRDERDYRIWQAETIRNKDFTGPVLNVDYRLVLEYHGKFSGLQNEPQRSLEKRRRESD